MLRAVVVGNVWATRRLAELPNGAFLEVEVEDGGARLVAFDVLGSGVGERVLVATGSVAAAWFPGKPPPLDALIIGSIDPDTGADAAATGSAEVDPAPRHAAGAVPPAPAAAPDPTPDRIVPSEPVTPVVPATAPSPEPPEVPAPPWTSDADGGT